MAQPVRSTMAAEHQQFTGYTSREAQRLSQDWPSVSFRIGRACLGGGQAHDVPGGPWTRVSQFTNNTQVTRDVRPIQPPEFLEDGRMYVEIFNGMRGEVSSSFGAIEVDDRNLATLHVFTPPTSV